MSDEVDDHLDEEDDHLDEEDETEAHAFERRMAGSRQLEAYLIVVEGLRAGEMIKIGERLTLGRGAGADYRIDDPGVSKVHVCFEQDEQGEIIVRDLQSRNGTYVDGEPIESALLRDGNKIHVGSTTILKFSLADDIDESFQRRMYDAALRDSLTGLNNRRHLMERLDPEIAYALRHSTPLSVIMIDIDHFKRLNDGHGHLAGDAALSVLGAMISELIRKEDFAARYGGEEFVVVCRGTTASAALTLANRLREAVASATIVAQQPELRITVSLGIAGLDLSPGKNALGLIARADKALYQAKRNGRNCVFTDQGD